MESNICTLYFCYLCAKKHGPQIHHVPSCLSCSPSSMLLFVIVPVTESNQVLNMCVEPSSRDSITTEPPSTDVTTATTADHTTGASTMTDPSQSESM